MALELGLVGRRTETDLIDGLLDGAPEHGSTLLIVGEPGIGKSALLSVAAGLARGRGMGVLATAGVEAEAHLPFAALHRLLRPVLGEADGLPQPQRDALQAAFGETDAAEPELFRIALAALHLLAAAAERRPLLVVVEDAQWLDRSTIDVLAFVARRIHSDPIVLLAATRDDGLGDGLPSLRLTGLDEPAARSLLAAHAGELAAATVDRLVETAGGNPLALVELPVAWREATRGSTLPDWLPLTRRLEHAFAARTSDMPPATRTLLLVAAADEEALLPDLFRAARTVVGRRVDEAELRPAVAADLVHLNESHLRFRHPLVRSAIYQTAPFDERHAVHAALADALVAEPDRRAWHRAASTIAPDDRVADELDASAERARRRGGISVAVAILERAAHFSGDPGRRGELLLRAAELGFEAGNHDAGKGTIVNVASVNAFYHPDGAVIDYGAAKAALLNLTKALAQELGPRGIRINAVSPGPVETDLWLGEHGVAQTVAAAGGIDAGTAREQIVAGMGGIPSGRFTRPEEVATLVALLASPRTGNVTGANYLIDGGLIKTT
jgi:NAD(P)-dependent dehydrogenase (short-subunit alcohol dehydrogenase family)